MSKPVRFLVRSDTHNLTLTNDRSLPFRLSGPEADVVLQYGDLTENGSTEDLQNPIRMMRSIKAESRLIIAGNHDISLDREYRDLRAQSRWRNVKLKFEEQEETGVCK
jgi:predicted phosphodiesterase